MKDVMANVNLRYDADHWVKGLSFRAVTNIAVQSLTGIVRERREPTYRMTFTPSGDTTYTAVRSAMAQGNNFNTVFNARYWFGQFGVDYARTWQKHHLNGSLMSDQRRTFFNYDLPAVANNATDPSEYATHPRSREPRAVINNKIN